MSIGLLIFACGGAQPPIVAPPAASGLGVPTSGVASGVRRDGFDLTVAPTEDFFRHVNGAWLDTTQIPADKSDYGSFTVLQDAAEANQRAIIDECVAGLGQPSTNDSDAGEARKIGDLYQSFMEENKIEKRGLTPVVQQLAAIEKLSNASALWREMGQLERSGISGPIGFFVGQDAKASEQYIGQFYQSGLGLPDRDYYLKSDERFVGIRGKYLTYLQEALLLAGVSEPEVAAKRVVALETKLAQLQWTRVARRDRNKRYNKQTMAGLSKLAPEIDWLAFLQGAHVPAVEAVILRQDSYFEALSKLMPSVTLTDWKAYLTWAVLRGRGPYLNKAMVDANFNFYGSVLRGTKVNRERWKRAVDTVKETLGQAVGKRYVRKHFSPAAKAKMETMVANLLKAFGEGIDELQWMSDETKQQARAKLSLFVAKIGYPSVWLDYTALEIKPEDLFGNIVRAHAFQHDRRVAKLSGPVDREEWFITPQTVNAYYSSSKNEIVFPAAILQPPFFNPDADDAINYGAIGAVIGHEISHGFDDQGRKSDGHGDLRDWWLPADASAFAKRTAAMVKQYGAFKPFDDASVNGELTLGENIGDLGGLTIAYRAYLLSLQGKAAAALDGYTGEQRFFIGWAQIWRRKYRQDELRRRLLTDPHAPSQYRVNGVLANMPEFYRAFEVGSGDAMWRSDEERIKIW